MMVFQESLFFDMIDIIYNSFIDEEMIINSFFIRLYDKCKIMKRKLLQV